MEFNLELHWCEAGASKSLHHIYANRNRLSLRVFKNVSYEGEPIAMSFAATEIDEEDDDVKSGFELHLEIIGRDELTALRDIIDAALKNIRDGEDA
jgi:hypothetical protein